MTGFLDVYDLMRLLKRSRATIYRWLGEGRIPEADAVITERSVRWREATIQRWIDRGCPKRTARTARGGKGKQKEAVQS